MCIACVYVHRECVSVYSTCVSHILVCIGHVWMYLEHVYMCIGYVCIFIEYVCICIKHICVSHVRIMCIEYVFMCIGYLCMCIIESVYFSNPHKSINKWKKKGIYINDISISTITYCYSIRIYSLWISEEHLKTWIAIMLKILWKIQKILTHIFGLKPNRNRNISIFFDKYEILL